MIVPFAALLFQALAPAAPSAPEGKVVRVWLDAHLLTRGAPVRVYVQAAEDGNLVVLHRRTDGRIEVLFPNSPAADPSVRAGTYEIRGPNDRPGWVVREPDGTGMVLAALSPDPLRVDEFARQAAWNPDALVPTWSGADGEGVMSDVVQRMLGDGYFHYDLVTYTVAPPIYARPYLAPQDTGPSYASYLPSPDYAPCLACTFIGTQVILVEPFSVCDEFVSACVGGRAFAARRDPCGSLMPCGAPPQSALALALGPLPPPDLATVSPGRPLAAPRGASGPTPIAPRLRTPEPPVRSRAPARSRAEAFGAIGSRLRSPEAESATHGGTTSVEAHARVALAAPGAPLSHVRFTRLSTPTSESPAVVTAVRTGTGRALTPAAGAAPERPGTLALPGLPGALGGMLPRSGIETTGGNGAQGPPLQQGARDRLGEGRAMAPAGNQPSIPGRAAATTVASGAGVTRSVAFPPAVWGSAGAHTAPARPSIPVRRR
jgi:hypothetical protein